MRSTRKPVSMRETTKPKKSRVGLWHNIELLIGLAMFVLSTGTLFTMLNWPLRLSGMNYWLIIIPYLSLTGALVTAQIIRRDVKRKENA